MAPPSNLLILLKLTLSRWAVGKNTSLPCTCPWLTAGSRLIKAQEVTGNKVIFTHRITWHIFTKSTEIPAPSSDRLRCEYASILHVFLLFQSLTIISASSFRAPRGAGWRRKEEAGWVIAGNGVLSCCLNTVSSVPGLWRKISLCCCVFCLRWHTGGSGSCPGPWLWLRTITADVPQAVWCFLILNFKHKWLIWEDKCFFSCSNLVHTFPLLPADWTGMWLPKQHIL